jgi:hypothetical protein
MKSSPDIVRVAIWSVERDNGARVSIEQESWAFSHLFGK